MSALATESAVKVRQKAFITIMNSTTTAGKARSTEIWYAFKALFLHLASNKGNPDLEFKILTSGDNATIVGEACTLYAVYGKKGTVATASYLKVSNHATQVQADSFVILESAVAGEEVFTLWPDGLALGTGLTAGSYTAYNGSNATTSSTATHNFYGFAIVGA